MSKDGTVQVWEASTGHLICTYKGYPDPAYQQVYGVAWSPEGKYLASFHSSYDSNRDIVYNVQVWDASNGRHISSITQPEYCGAAAMAWSPDSTRLAVESCNSGMVWVWATLL